MKKINKYLILFSLSFGILVSCSEADLDPTLEQDKSIETSINTAGDLQAILIGGMHRMQASAAYGRDVIVLGEVFSDNTASNANSNRFVAESEMSLTATSAIANDLWAQFYRIIGSSNIIINAEGIEGDQDEIDQIKGQAYALRALAHFNLLTFYGQQHVDGGGMNAMGIPYVTVFRDSDNLFPSRSTVEEVKNFIYKDLETAFGMMSESLDDSSKEFISSNAVKAIEARVSNYFGDFSRSLTAAKAVIDSNKYTIIAQNEFLNSFAIDGAANSIFEIANSATDNEDINGLANIYQAGSYGDVIALPNLVNIYDVGDVRGVTPFNASQVSSVIAKDNNGTFRNVGKYPSTAPYEDNISVIRFEEVVLLYAEALLETSNPGDALTYLNMIPAKRGGSLYTVANKENILLERRKELAFEGFRFHDLARTGQDIPNPDPVLITHGVVKYGSVKFALPIPNAEAGVNANVKQNKGF